MAVSAAKVTRQYAALILGLIAAAATPVQSIGVNYGTLANNLPPPSQVATFLKNQTTIDRIKIFDVNHDILLAFAGTGILVAVTVPNGEIPSLTDPASARSWVFTNILPFHPHTRINYLLVGNEILHWGPQNLRDNLVSAVRTLHQALLFHNITDIKVTTAHSLGILESSNPPSKARFQKFWADGVLAPLLQFHNETESPFMVNPYPFFGYSQQDANFTIFGSNKGVFDKGSKKTYGNMFDLLMDAVYVSMIRLNYKSVKIAVGETGWASAGDQPGSSVENAAAYNDGLVRKYNSGQGTPLMRKRKFDTYIFGLFDENMKPGSLSEQHFGLFRNDFTPVYDIGIMRQGFPQWCVPMANVTDNRLQANIDYVCGHGVDCKPIQQGGSCFYPNTLTNHASFIMNSFYRTTNHSDCNFEGSGMLTSTNPSTATCIYV